MEYHATRCISKDGVHRGEYRFIEGRWVIFDHHAGLPSLKDSSYFVSTLPVDFHCHGIGDFDFSELRKLDLASINASLMVEGVRAVLTIYLEQTDFDDFLFVMADFWRAKCRGDLPNIVAFALEGPMLTSPGGTPLTTIWAPTKTQWRQLADLGHRGLAYVVLSPDVEIGPDADVFLGGNPLPPTIDWIVETLIEGGVRPALGHFQKSNPAGSAACTRRLLDIGRSRQACMVTDHLLNDMPRAIKHAWRTREEKQTREADLAKLGLSTWTVETIADRVGPVPGEIIRGCLEGVLTPCMNFDGEHLDLAISTRIVELVGSGNIIGMTDRIESKRLGGRALEESPDSGLLYQGAGLVAAGTRSIFRQVDNCLLTGMPASDIWNMFCFVPERVLNISQAIDKGPTDAIFIQAGTAPRTVRAPHRALEMT